MIGDEFYIMLRGDVPHNKINNTNIYFALKKLGPLGQDSLHKLLPKHIGSGQMRKHFPESCSISVT